MKIKYTLLLVFNLIMISCSNTISTTKKGYAITQKSELKSDWNLDSKEWFLDKDTLIGIGSPLKWSVLESKKKLSKNYEINLKVNVIQESLFEIMLHIDQNKYIRTYLYKIDQNLIIGRGVYNKNSDEYGKHGGPSIFTKAINLENNKWYSVKIKVLNNHLFFSVNNETSLECAIVGNNLSQKGKLGFITNGKVKITDIIIKNLK
ncbi:hypothetical protein SGQ44_16230 [Flavobacterium sp. Fl-77]|uniref:3-keto-disaccharide hydrolase domain-containing protein n=1 Tax=Flavobacterium flavipigmentatum TaxID=2893884 RepID=A0AAJ2SJH2_9FLAO|nr:MULTISPECIES: hypothetical protein [unclassified Flavobacterium]MDX6183725.1 hypothetical protein [Flavobacterium sp. Fl-33]MDX6187314.1 hypothetical protein [Flavobacterium sp. Fl-77]UFH38129.1 hypothetical protein LNP22_15475 [Flavobacterium sp. F-70]